MDGSATRPLSHELRRRLLRIRGIGGTMQLSPLASALHPMCVSPAFRRRACRPIAPALLVALLVLPGCAGLFHKRRGAATPVSADAAVSTAVGATTTSSTAGRPSTARTAILGAVAGGAVGATIAHQMDQQARELAQNIPEAKVERIGEGIQVTFFTGQLFEFDSDRVLGESARNLRTLARSLDKYPGSNLLIVGHTDSLGTSAYNLDLSVRRARATAAFLTSQGVLLERMKNEGRGELEPIADNSTEAGQARNRRVEVAIFASDAYRQQLLAKGKKKT